MCGPCTPYELSRRVKGIFIADYEQGGGDVLFRVACNMDSKASSQSAAIVSMRPVNRHWLKVKNPAHPAYSRVRDWILATGTRK
jgi:bifunctional non-homologous end joining protein LigD